MGRLYDVLRVLRSGRGALCVYDVLNIPVFKSFKDNTHVILVKYEYLSLTCWSSSDVFIHIKTCCT